MDASEERAKQMLDCFYQQHRELERELNGLPRELALSDPTHYKRVHDCSHSQLQELSCYLGASNQTSIAKLLHGHPLHREILLQSAFIRQAFSKPNGYAGDKDLTLIICNSEDRGDTNFSILLNRVYLALPAAVAVRQRVKMLHRVLQEVPAGGKVLTLACGPALEVQEFLRASPDSTVSFDLVDHDIDTIRYLRRTIARDNVRALIGNALQITKGNYRTAIPRDILESMCQPRADFKGARALLAPLKYRFHDLQRDTYDLVYAPGLFDYIKDFPGEPKRGAAGLTRRLFDLVKPGGKLVLGNFLEHADTDPHKRIHLTIMEMYGEWFLLYRSPAAIRGFMAGVEAGRYTAQLTDEHFTPYDEPLRGAIGLLVVTRLA